MAVYTHISDDELRVFLRGFDIGDLLSFKGIAEGVENSNYVVHTSGGTYILTLYEKRVREEDLPFFLKLMEHLAARGISCPLPVKGRSGEVLHELAGKPAALITFLEGVSVSRPSAQHCSALGSVLALFHAAGSDFDMSRQNSLSVAGWRELYESCGSRIDDIAPGLNALISEELAVLDERWPTDLPQGIIHADMFPDNVFFLGDNLSGVIDFYFACKDMMAYDLAICLNAWCFEPDHSLNITKARGLMSAYHNARPMSEAEISAFPLLCRGASMRFLMTRIYDWLHTDDNAFVTRKDPMEYVRKLKFHQSIGTAREYGLD